MDFEAKKRALNEVLSNFKSFLTDKKDELATVVLEQVVNAHLKNFQDKIAVGMQDSFADYFKDFKQEMSQAIIDYSRQWLVYNENHALVFPKNCKFMYTQQNHLVVVIEEEPKCRSLLLQDKLLEPYGRSKKTTSNRHYLSLPYVLFIVHFMNTKDDLSGEWVYQETYTAWNNTSLQTIQDFICKPVLPNLKDTLAVCFGNSLRFTGTTISQKIQDIISTYWNTCFNSDLSVAWNEKGSVDSRIKSVQEWVKNTNDNPGFILECNWKVRSKLIEFLNTVVLPCEVIRVDVATAFKENLDSLIDDFFAGLARTVEIYSSQTKTERYYPKDVIDKLTSNLSAFFNQIVKLLEILQKDVDKIEKQHHNSAKDVAHYGFVCKSPYWS